MKETKSFIVVDKLSSPAPYRVNIEAKSGKDAIKYFFSLENIKDAPVSTKSQEGIKSALDGRYMVLNCETNRTTYYNIDGQALDMQRKELYTVDKVYKLKKAGRIR